MIYDPEEFEWFNAALAHVEAGGSPRDPAYPRVFNDTAMTGTYAYRPTKSEPPKAVFFWYSKKEKGKLLCRINGEDVKYGLDIWKSCATHPIPRAVYNQVLETGAWPSEVTVQFADGRTDSSMVDTRGHNSGDVPGAVRHKGDIEEWVEKAKKLIKLGSPDTQAEADTLADVKTKLADLIRDAEKAREDVTKPLWQAFKNASDEWKSFITPAESYIPSLQRLIDTYIRKEHARRMEEARKTNEAAAAKAAAEAAAAAPAAGKQETLAPEPEVVVEPVRVTVGTRKTIKAAQRRVVVIEDIKKVMAHFAAMEPVPPEILKVINDKAMVLLSNGVPVPGAKLEMETVGK